MRNRKVKYLLFNLVKCVFSFIAPFYVLSEIAKINPAASAMISILFYVIDVRQQTDSDYLSERIDDIENKNK